MTPLSKQNLPRAITVFALVFSFFAFAKADPAFACDAGEIDVLDYIIPLQDGRGNNMNNDELFRTYTDTVEGKSGFYIMKSAGSPKWFESHNYDNNYIYLINDTTWSTAEGAVECPDGSEASAAYYDSSNSLGGPRFPRCMALGTTYSVSGQIMGLSKSGCELCNTPYSGSYTFHKRITHQGGYTLPSTGVGLTDAIIIHEDETGEDFIFDKDYGWVGWRGSSNSAYWDGTRASGPGPAELPCDEIPQNLSTNCVVRTWNKIKSTFQPDSTDRVHYALKERVKAECTSLWSLLNPTCIIQAIAILFEAPASFWYKQGLGPTSLARLEQQALRSTAAVGGIYAGIIPRALSPSHKFAYGGVEPMKQLTQAEGQKVYGDIESNRESSGVQTVFDEGEGEYKTTEDDVKDYKIKNAKFPFIPAVYDKFRFLQQLVPGAAKTALPNIICPADAASKIIEFLDEPHRDTDWEAWTEPGEVPCQPDDPNDPDCGELAHPSLGYSCSFYCINNPGAWLVPPDGAPNCDYCGCGRYQSVLCTIDGGISCVPNPGLCGNGECPCTGEKKRYVEAVEDNTTNVGGVDKAYNVVSAPAEADASGKLTKPGGILTVFAPPESNYKEEELREETGVDFTYNPKSTGLGNVKKDDLTLPIAHLGGVSGAYSCVVDQMLDTPYNAAQGVCEEWMENLPQTRAVAQAPSHLVVLGAGTVNSAPKQSFWNTLGTAVGRILNRILNF